MKSQLAEILDCATIGCDEPRRVLPRRAAPLDAFDPLPPMPTGIINKDGRYIQDQDRDYQRLLEARLLRSMSGRGWITRDEIPTIINAGETKRILARLVKANAVEQRYPAPVTEYRYRSRRELINAMKRGE